MKEYIITINGQPVVCSDSLPDTRSKNQKRKDRKEYFKQKRTMRGSLSFEIPIEKPWHERIIIKGDKE